MSEHKELRHKLAELEHRLEDHDGAIRNLISTIHQLMEPPATPSKLPIGFAPWPANKIEEIIS